MELCSADRSEKKTNERRLEPMLWHLAWDAYALAAAALGQVCHIKNVLRHVLAYCDYRLLCKLPFDTAMKHKHIVMDLVVTARAKKMTPLLGVLYDELVRCVDVSVHSACVLL